MDKTKNNFISIIVACKNEENYILKLLDSLEMIDYPKDKFEVIIIDGKSSDNSLILVNDYKKYTNLNLNIYINEEEKTPYAFNLGIKKSIGDIIIIAGARFQFSVNYLKVANRVLTEHLEIGCVGGKIINKYENDTSEIISKAMNSIFGMGFGNFRVIREDMFVDTVTPPAFRKDIFDKIGFFDERLTRNQDDDFSYRLIKFGYKILLKSDIYVYYTVRSNYKNLFQQFKQYGYWKVFVNLKHATITTTRQLVPAFFIFSILFFFIGAFYKKIFLYLIIIELGLYFSINFFYSCNHSRNFFKNTIKQMFTYFTIHISYGLGYIQGIRDFIILKKEPNKNNEKLTR